MEFIVTFGGIGVNWGKEELWGLSKFSSYSHSSFQGKGERHQRILFGNFPDYLVGKAISPEQLAGKYSSGSA
jgi:hypothetical protein